MRVQLEVSPMAWGWLCAWVSTSIARAYPSETMPGAVALHSNAPMSNVGGIDLEQDSCQAIY